MNSKEVGKVKHWRPRSRKINGEMYFQKKGLYSSKKSVQATVNYMKRYYGYKSIRTIKEDDGYRIYTR